VQASPAEAANGSNASGAPTGQPIAAPNHHLDETYTSIVPSDSTVETYGRDLAPQRERGGPHPSPARTAMSLIRRIGG
jgi:hypothetical protein